MALNVSFKAGSLPTSLQSGVAKQIIGQGSLACANELAVALNIAMVKISPTDTGLLRAGWIADPAVKTQTGAEAFVKNSTEQAAIVERGLKPGRKPTPGSLNGWVRRKLGISSAAENARVARLIDRSISRKGIKARRLFSKARTAIKPVLNSIRDACRGRIAKALQP